MQLRSAKLYSKKVKRKHNHYSAASNTRVISKCILASLFILLNQYESEHSDTYYTSLMHGMVQIYITWTHRYQNLHFTANSSHWCTGLAASTWLSSSACCRRERLEVSGRDFLLYTSASIRLYNKQLARCDDYVHKAPVFYVSAITSLCNTDVAGWNQLDKHLTLWNHTDIHTNVNGCYVISASTTYTTT